MDDLVKAAQRGDTDAQAALWGHVRRLGYTIANQYYKAAAANRAVNEEDLIQCAALGMMEALQSYDGEKGSFSTWMFLHVRKSCRECLGLNGRYRGEHYNVISIDAPMGVEELTLSDMMPDESAEIAFRAAEDAHDNDILRRDLDAALARLPAPMRDAINHHDIEGQQLSPEQVQHRRTGLNRLRRDPKLAVYRPNYHRYKSLAAFRHTWSSVVEDIVIEKLDRRKKT